MQRDNTKVPYWRLARHRLLVTPEVNLRSGERKRLLPRAVKMAHGQYGLWESELDLITELGKFFQHFFMIWFIYLQYFR